MFQHYYDKHLLKMQFLYFVDCLRKTFSPVGKAILLFFVFIFFVLRLNAQVTREYFQQEVNYRMQVSFDDVHHMLRGDISIEYINHSPDTLRFIYFHLWPNAYKNNYTAFAKQMVENGETDFYYAADSDRGYIDSLNFSVDGGNSRLEIDSMNID